jgi:hypothetical protein
MPLVACPLRAATGGLHLVTGLVDMGKVSSCASVLSVVAGRFLVTEALHSGVISAELVEVDAALSALAERDLGCLSDADLQA